MPSNYGRAVFQTTGYAVRVSADGNPGWKIGGITLDPSTLPTNATGAPLLLAVDQTTINPGQAYLLLGTVMCRITTGAIIVVTETGVPTAGTFTATVTAGGTTTTTSALAQAATAAAVQAALVALTNVGAGGATVTGSNGGPYTVTFATTLGLVTMALGTNSLTGGTSPSVTLVNTTSGDTGGFGPFLSTASDGRQTLSKGDCYILDETWMDVPVPAFGATGTKHPPVFDSGSVDVNKLVLSTGQGANALPAGYPAGPTLANLLAVVGVKLVND
jgi:hypothetical protein